MLDEEVSAHVHAEVIFHGMEGNELRAVEVESWYRQENECQSPCWPFCLDALEEKICVKILEIPYEMDVLNVVQGEYENVLLVGSCSLGEI